MVFIGQFKYRWFRLKSKRRNLHDLNPNFSSRSSITAFKTPQGYDGFYSLANLLNHKDLFLISFRRFLAFCGKLMNKKTSNIVTFLYGKCT